MMIVQKEALGVALRQGLIQVQTADQALQILAAVRAHQILDRVHPAEAAVAAEGTMTNNLF